MATRVATRPRRMIALPRLLAGLSWRRTGWTIVLSATVAGAIVGFFRNTFLDLLVSALCVGFSIMLLVTVAGNARLRRMPREALMMLAVVAGSWLRLCRGNAGAHGNHRETLDVSRPYLHLFRQM